MNRLLLRAAYWLVGRTPPPTNEDVVRAELEAKTQDTRIRNAEAELKDVYDKEKQMRNRGKGNGWYFDRYSQRFKHAETGLFISWELVLELEGGDLRLPEKVVGNLELKGLKR